jgi:outer membrane immunogenic protein
MRHITRLCIGAAAATITLTAQAADVRVPVGKSAMSWTGWYVGASAGYGWSESDVDQVASVAFCNPTLVGCLPATGPFFANGQVAAIPTQLITHPSGALVGGQAGYNYQAGSTVVGLETDISWTGIKGSNGQFGSAQLPGGFGNVVNAAATADQRLQYFGTLRARAGYLPADPLLLFVTGGLAYGQLRSNVNVTESNVFGGCFCQPIVPAITSSTTTRAGWTVGFGLEYVFSRPWSFKAEYLYFDLGHLNYQSTLTLANTAGTPFTAVGVVSTTHFTGNIFRAGLNYMFNAY